MPSPVTDASAPRSSKSPKLRGHTARDRAAHVLLRLHHEQEIRQGLTVQQAVDDALNDGSRLSRQDASLCTELAYGSLRHELRLQWLLNRHLDRPDKLPHLVRMILLVAAYELSYLDRIPAHATVNWAVQATRDGVGVGLSRLVNAVLRTIDRLGDAARRDDWYTAQIADPYERLSVVRSIPLWIARLWLDAYGPDMAEALAAASGATPWPAVRLNMSREGWEDLRNGLLDGSQGGTAGDDQSPRLPVGISGVMFPPGAWPDTLPALLRSGAASWQGSGTQEILLALHARTWKGPIWDACAGRGGKTCALLEMGLDVRLASDPHNARLTSLRQELDRLGLPHPEMRQGVAQDLHADFSARTILLDVPCSGLGTLARRPDVRLHRTPEQVRELVLEQACIVSAAWEQLAPGGRLVYMTCTSNPAENEEQIKRLLHNRRDARLELEAPVQANAHGADIMYGALVRKAG